MRHCTACKPSFFHAKMKPLDALTANTGNRTDCWNTPKHIVQDVLTFFDGSIGLDPCSNSHASPNVPANQLYTRDEDGLSKEWNEPTVYMNHPYSESKLWVPYAVEQHTKHSNEMLLLIKLDVSTKWWRSVADKPWLAFNKRLRFGNASSAAPFQSALIYLGYNLDKFVDIFNTYGHIYRTI